jgi:C-terminal processing protease CtpA/Prc
MWINRGAGSFELAEAVAGGPADRVACTRGDTIVAVEGTPAENLSPPDVRLRLRTDPPGTRVRVKVLSGGA